MNEMVSLGDTTISLHILQLLLTGGGGCQELPKFSRKGVLESQNPKCQDLPKFQLSGRGGGGCSGTIF